ncbi:putative phosphatidate phosphatase [Anticarsia gemmatalis]|uniref:putative phosphatidate phosphatase n=1 Tax=Anticarsia gemmatalis TaxID=129554 RepID=UPI003F76A626
MSRDDESIHIMKRVVVDGFLLIGLILGILATNLAWEPFQRGFFCGDESLMYPYHSDTVTVLMLRLVGLLPPAIAFLICEWCVLRKERDTQRCLGVRVPTWVRGFYCVLASFGIGCCFVELAINIAKSTIGRPRPHFFEICVPSIDCSKTEWQGRYIKPTDYTCTGTETDKFEDMRKSFLSGHSAWAAFTMLYLAMYLESRMQWRGSRTLRHTLQFIAVMLSWYCALSRISDFKHHWSDVLAGYTLGLLFAIAVWVWGTEIVKRQKDQKGLPQYDIAVTSVMTQRGNIHNTSN